MIANKFVREKLLADAYIANTVGDRIYDALPEQDAEFPCIVISNLGTQELDSEMELAHIPTIRRSLIRIDYFIRNHNRDFYDELEALGVAINDALNRYRGIFNNMNIRLCKFTDEGNDDGVISDMPDVYFDHQQYEITTKE